MSWRAVTAFKRLMGEHYQEPGPTPRGEARPEVEAPSAGAATASVRAAGAAE
jgi:hypothetical protein